MTRDHLRAFALGFVDALSVAALFALLWAVLVFTP